MSRDQLSAVLSDFARTMLTDFPIQGILDELVGRIVELMPITGAGVTLISDDRSPQYVAASDAVALRFERLQTSLWQGPCVLAHDSDTPVSVPDLAADAQFPDFGPQAVAAGLLAVFTFPLRHGDLTLGALDLYRDQTGPLDAADMATAQTLADVASAYLINAQAREEAAASVRRLHHLALHDVLTDLPNRALLHQRLERAAAAHPTAMAAVLFVDLDRFKTINDNYGHQVGDDLLIAVARRLSRLIRPGDTLARVSGDEFVLLYENLPAQADVEALAIRVEAAFDEPFELPRAELQVAITASIGIAHAGTDRELGDAVIEEADLAMYQAKRLGGGGHHLADPRDTPHLGTRPRLEQELRTALATNALDVAYQPVIRCTDRVTHGVEALLRWTHPLRGAVAPQSMIALAEHSGLIVELGEWVLERACRDHGRWVDAHPAVVLDLSVNVSARQLVSPDYVNSIARVLHRTAMDPRRLVLEITENVFLEDSELVTSVMNGIVALGVRLALDDFGTGYSSLAYLRRLPITFLKIDQTFTTDIDNPTWGGAIIASVTDLAHTLALEVVVEGVETAHHHDEVTALGCDYAQGYLYGRPSPAADIEAMLTTARTGRQEP